MADLIVTASSVLSSQPLNAQRAVASVAITAGQPVYKKSDGTISLSQANGIAPSNSVTGVAINNAAVGQPIAYVATDPSFTPGFTALSGDVIYVSDNVGMVTKTYADVLAGSTVIALGTMTTTTTMNLNPTVGGTK